MPLRKGSPALKLDTIRPFAGHFQFSRFGADALALDFSGGLDFAGVGGGFDCGLGTTLPEDLGACCDVGRDERLLEAGGTRRKVCPA